MSRELDALLRMLSSPDAELQCAAARVLGELGHATEDTVRHLAKLLEEGAGPARAYALDALGRSKRADALKHVVRALAQPDPLRAKARDILVSAGPDVLGHLTPFLDRKSPELRMAVVETLGRMRSRESLDLLMECLKDPDFEVVKSVSAFLRQRIDAVTDKERKEVFERCVKLLAGAEKEKNRNAAVSSLRLLGHLKNPDAVPHLLKHVAASYPGQVRANALLSLAHVPLDKGDAKQVAERVLPLLGDDDYANVVQHALTVLDKVSIPAALQRPVEKLLESPHHSVRLFAVRALGTTGSRDSADRLLGMIDHPDAKQAEEAIRALGNPAYAKPVLAAFLRIPTLQRGWTLVNILKAQGTRLEGKVRQSTTQRLFAAVDKGRDEMKVYFEALRASDPERLRDHLLEKGQALRRKKNFALAERYLNLVMRDDLATPDAQYELALARLGQLDLDVSRPARDTHNPLNHLANLLRNPAFPLLKRVKIERPPLSPAMLLYIGFHLVERTGPEREFGAEVLKLLLHKRGGDRAEGRIGRQKLRTEGLA